PGYRCDARRAETVAVGRNRSWQWSWSALRFVWSMLNLPREPVAVFPERAFGARFAFGIVDAFLVRATDAAIRRHHDRFRVRPGEIREHFCFDDAVVAYIAIFGVPLFHGLDIATFMPDERSHGLARMLVVGAVKRHGDDRIPAKPFFLQLLAQ